jgi:thiol:disulfide interchange protein DsbD
MKAFHLPGKFRSVFLAACRCAFVVLGLSLFTGISRAQDPFFAPKKDDAKPVERIGKKYPTDDIIDFEIGFKPASARRGQVVTLTIKGTPKPGYHTYPLTQRTAEQIPAQLSKLKWDETGGLKPLAPISETEPEQVFEEGSGALLEHKKPFIWSQDLLIPEDATTGPRKLRFRIDLQVCDRTCKKGEPQFEGTVLVADGPAVPLAPEVQKRLQAPADEIKVVTVLGSGGSLSGSNDFNISPSGLGSKPVTAAPQPGISIVKPASPTEPDSVYKAALEALLDRQKSTAATVPITESETDYQATMNALRQQIEADQTPAPPVGLLSFMLTGVFWGAVSLITPCVFPMIPITVSFFLKQSEKAHHRPVTMALVYCLTIVVVLTISAVALLSFFRWLSVNPIMNFALGALFVIFALSLFGMYDLELPSFLTRFTSTRESKGGLVGVMFMALTFTIVSFACVAPFLGGFGGTAAGSNYTLLHRVLGGFAFAATFAAPFFILALFPNLLRKMPKSGSWLNNVKVVMGFLELAAALKFFRAGELVNSPTAAFFTYDLVLGMWIALALLCGAYLLNLYRLPYDTPAESIGVPRLIFGALFLSLSFYLLPALFRFSEDGEKQRPNGTIYAWIDSFLLPEPSEGKEELNWSGNLMKAVHEARAARQNTRTPQLVFVDFTGETCTNCKFNEKTVFTKADIKKLFQPYRLVQLFTDKVPDKYYSSELRAAFGNSTSRQTTDAEVNLKFQRDTFGTEQLPLYVILEPLPDGKIRVVSRYEEGKINNAEAFAQFLREPLGSESSGLRAQAP